MSSLVISGIEVVANGFMESPEQVPEEYREEAQMSCSLNKFFGGDEDRHGRCKIDINYDLNSPYTLYMQIFTQRRDTTLDELLMLCLDGREDIDALRRFCEMVLDHTDRSERELKNSK